MAKEFFYKKYEGNPKIYAYSDSHPQYSGFLKVGFTSKIQLHKEFRLSIQSLLRGKKHILFI